VKPTFSEEPTVEYMKEEIGLLEDIGIDLNAIKSKVMYVLTFCRHDSKINSVFEDAEMSGPLCIFLAFGSLLMLAGKLTHFTYIYGFSIIGTLGVYLIMNFLSQQKDIQLYNTLSILGYCMIPLTFLASLNIFIDLRNLVGFIVSFFFVFWAAYVATIFFEKVFSFIFNMTLKALFLNEQKWLLSYPIFLFYTTFVLITIF